MVDPRPARPSSIREPTPDLPTAAGAPVDVTRMQPSRAAGETDLEIGSMLGPYRLLAKLGEGGMGAVYKAQHEHLDKTVAVKVLPARLTVEPELVARFKREMKAVGKLDHPHIVRAMDAGEIGGVHFLVMEYLEGTDLHRLVKERGPMSVVNACKAVRQAALALAAAHQAGLVHRDIKPANLLLARNGQIKLLDLGLARLGEPTPNATELTQQGQACGTPDFMAPEQWHDARDADARSDLYSLGCTLFHLLTGRPPFAGETHPSVANKMKGHLLDPIPDLRALRPEIPDGLREIAQKLLAKSPAERYQTAAEVAEALAPWASSTVTTTASVVTSSVLPGTAPAETPSPATLQLPIDPPTAIDADLGSDHIRTNPTRPLAAAGLVAAVVLVAALGQLWGIRDVKTPGTGFPQSSATPTSIPEAPTSISEGPTSATAVPSPSLENANPSPLVAPFTAVQAKAGQEAWAKYLGKPVIERNSLGMDLILLPPGTFRMGSTAAQIDAVLKFDSSATRENFADEQAQHTVQLTKPFRLGATEVTVGQFRRFVTATGYQTEAEKDGEGGFGWNATAEKFEGRKPEYTWKNTGFTQTDNHPVVNVSWHDAQAFVEWLSRDEGLSYRLPTEAEWEYACRAGTTGLWWHGDDPEGLGTSGNVADGTGKARWGTNYTNFNYIAARDGDAFTATVGRSSRTNPFGLSDMHGNVFEWCGDWYDAEFYGKSSGTAVDPFNASPASSRVLRGGSWSNDAGSTRSAFRGRSTPDIRSANIGFRVSRTE